MRLRSRQTHPRPSTAHSDGANTIEMQLDDNGMPAEVGPGSRPEVISSLNYFHAAQKKACNGKRHVSGKTLPSA